MISRTALLALLGCLALSSVVVRAEDAADGEIVDEGASASSVPLESDEDGSLKASPDAAVSFLFTTPADANINRDLIGGKLVKLLIGFQNKGEKDFTVHFSETSFRYHQDFSYAIQNFTRGKYDRRVAPQEEVTLDYGFFVAEQFAGRPLGLTVQLFYEDTEGHVFLNTVFNETVTVLEDDSGFSAETYFLYIVFAGIFVLLLLVGQHYLNKLTRKAGMTKKRAPVVEQGTSSKGEVDFEWIPREVRMAAEKKSPKPGSPRARKAQKAE